MNISRVSFSNIKSNLSNFNGVYKKISRTTDIVDHEQGVESETINWVYYPNKYESEEEIRKNIDTYNNTNYSTVIAYPGGPARDIITENVCTRGGRLPW